MHHDAQSTKSCNGNLVIDVNWGMQMFNLLSGVWGAMAP